MVIMEKLNPDGGIARLVSFQRKGPLTGRSYGNDFTAPDINIQR